MCFAYRTQEACPKAITSAGAPKARILCESRGEEQPNWEGRRAPKLAEVLLRILSWEFRISSGAIATYV